MLKHTLRLFAPRPDFRELSTKINAMNRQSLDGKRVIIVGGVAGGASCAARLRRLSETVNITVLEKSSSVSYANCGLPYHISGTIADRSKLQIFTPKSFTSRFNVDTRVLAECIDVDRVAQTVKVHDLKTKEHFTMGYDYLVLACGAMPVIPPIPIETKRGGIFSLRTLDDLDDIMKYLTTNEASIKRAVVIGGGFIGLEMAENLKMRGLQTTVVEKMPQVMPMMDSEMAAIVENELRKNQVNLRLNSGAVSIDDSLEGRLTKQITLDDKTKLDADLVIFAIGVRPDAALAEKAGLKVSQTTRGIAVDDQMRSVTDPKIFAVGDSVEITDRISSTKSRIALAGPANRQGRVAADAIAGLPSRYPGGLGTNIVKVFEVALGSVGLTERKMIASSEFNHCHVAQAVANHHATYYPGSAPLFLKGIYEPTTGRLVGAQVAGKADAGVDKRLDVFATAIANNMTVHDLQYVDLAYSPPYGSAKDPVNHLATICVDQMMGLHPSCTWDNLEHLDTEVQLIDVRTKAEYAQGTIPSAKLIPLDEMRSRLQEIDKNKPAIVFCRVGMRGYLATRLLQEHGFNDVKNLMGGYLLFKEVTDAKKLNFDRSSHL